MELPSDVINIIYTFNADHREQMKPILKEIKRTYFIWSYKRCNKSNNVSTIESIRNNIEMKECEVTRHLNFWGNCICCRRHIVNKPSIFGNEYNYYYEQFSEYINEKDFHGPIMSECKDINKQCNCVCRHFSRWIVRAYTMEDLI